MTDEEKLKYCSGCRNDFYNGHNPLGVKRCWSLPTAKLVKRKEVHRDHVPPWNQKPINVLTCYHRAGWFYMEPDRTC